MPLQDGEVLAERDQAAGEFEKDLLAIVETPIHPRDLVVLAIGVVVAALRAPHLVAGEEHGHSLRKEQRRKEVAFLPLAQRDDAFVVGFPLHAVVPGIVVVGAIAVVLAVGLVVLGVVADEIVERETVVGSDEVDGVCLGTLAL